MSSHTLQELVQKYESLSHDLASEILRDSTFRCTARYKTMKKALFDLWQQIQVSGKLCSLTPEPEDSPTIIAASSPSAASAVSGAETIVHIEDEIIDLGKQAPPHAWLLTMIQEVSQVASAQLTQFLCSPTHPCH